MTDEQRKDVRDLTRKAGITRRRRGSPPATRCSSG